MLVTLKDLFNFTGANSGEPHGTLRCVLELEWYSVSISASGSSRVGQDTTRSKDGSRHCDHSVPGVVGENSPPGSDGERVSFGMSGFGSPSRRVRLSPLQFVRLSFGGIGLL
mmetsp:Transcript_4274/g.6497  ORF Transcript_4274/g.6497 Transcript_4274/m.6497 type:complete len:112 (-) Transcript_4274:1024-1359(-)